MATANVVQTSISGGTSNALALQGDGAFLPKLNTAARAALSLGTPDKGLMVYDTTLTAICVWNGTDWEFIGDSSSGWVSTSDFGAKGDSVTDDTVAVQNAVDYCIANDLNLLVRGTCLLTSSVNIDRIVDGAAFQKYFIITGLDGGGFIAKSNIAMFSTTINNGNAPATQCVLFSNLGFQTDDRTRTVYVLDQNKFLRTSFSGCSFSQIKCLFAPVLKYTQSIFFIGCNIREWNGVFFRSYERNYDLKVVNCLVEIGGNNGGDAFEIVEPIGCAFIGSDIEGMDNFAIKYTKAFALNISGCYFEANGDGTVSGCSVDGSAGTGATASPSVSITGCLFVGDAGNTAKPCVRWGDCNAGISSGNASNTTLHNFGANSRVDVISDFATVSLSNTNAYRWFRDRTQQGYGGVIYPNYTGGLGGTLSLRSLNNNVPSTNGLDVDYNGDTITTGNLRQYPAASVTPTANGQLVVEKTSNTSLTFYLKGSDGVVRKAALTLAP